jgi:hypothetical protein
MLARHCDCQQSCPLQGCLLAIADLTPRRELKSVADRSRTPVARCIEAIDYAVARLVMCSEIKASRLHNSQGDFVAVGAGSLLPQRRLH